MKKGKTIYFKGYYGFKNMGDDIFAVTADWLCNNIWEDGKAIFIGSDLPKLSTQAKIIKIKNPYLRKLYEYYLINQVDYIIYLGGSLFGKFGNFMDIKHVFNKFSRFHSKLGTIGTSVGPFKNEQDFKAITGFLSKFNFVAVRDYSSIEIFKKSETKIPYSFSFDVAVLIDEVFPSLKQTKKKNSNGPKRLGVSLNHYERYGNGDIEKEQVREKAVLKFLEAAVEKHKDIEEVVFFEFNGDKNIGDLEIIQKFDSVISKKIKTKIIKYDYDTERFLTELNQCDFMLGVRLHSAISSYALNIPFMLVEYHKKNTEFLNTIEHHYRFDVNDLDKNLNSFSKLLELGYVPNMKKPEEFKEILLNKFKEIKHNFL